MPGMPQTKNKMQHFRHGPAVWKLPTQWDRLRGGPEKEVCPTVMISDSTCYCSARENVDLFQAHEDGLLNTNSNSQPTQF
jgi:hypothetical protein